MADDNFDPCECMWSHELAMRRLLSLLRQSQAYCTDDGCVDEIPSPLAPQSDGSDNTMMLVTFCWVAFALVLYLMRPTNMRNRGSLDSKPRESNQDPPPAPPSVQ